MQYLNILHNYIFYMIVVNITWFSSIRDDYSYYITYIIQLSSIFTQGQFFCISFQKMTANENSIYFLLFSIRLFT